MTSLKQDLDRLIDDYGLESWTYKDEFRTKLLATIRKHLPEKKPGMGYGYGTEFEDGKRDGWNSAIDAIESNLQED